MNKSIKKFGTVMLSGAMLFSAAGAVMNQNIFAGQLDKKIEVTAIKSLTAWCWNASTHMMLRQYLEANEKLSKGESIYEKYGDQCVGEAIDYYTNTGENFKKSKEEFEQLYDKIFITKTLSLGVALGSSPTEQQKKQEGNLQNIKNNLKDNPTDKDAAFLVYLSSGKLNSSSYKDVFTVHDGNAIQAAVSIVLRAAGMSDENCYIAQFGASNEDTFDYKLGILDYVLGRNSSVVSNTGKVGAAGHFKIINGIKDDKVCVQETGGQKVSEQNTKNYLNTQTEFIFIDSNFGLKSDGTLDGIWFIDPDKNKDGAVYEKGRKIRVGLTKSVDSIKLVNNDDKDKYLTFKKVSGESRTISGTCFDFREIYFYETELTEDGLTISDLKTNYHFDESDTNESDTDDTNKPENESSSSDRESKSLDDQLNINDTKPNVNEPEADVNNTKPDINNTINNITNSVVSSSSSSGGGSSSSGSSSSSGGGYSSSGGSVNMHNTATDVKKLTDDVNKTTNDITNLVTYEYNADNVKAISAEDAIKTYLSANVDLTNVKDNKTIIFKTNKYNNNNNKENLAIWNFELVNLKKDFAEAYTQIQNYEAKEKTGALNEEEKGKIQELKAQMKGYNFKLNIKNTSVEDSAVPDKIKEIFRGKNSILVDFSEGGIFPGEATVDVNLGKDKANKEYIVYYLNIVNGNKKVQLLSTDIKATSDGYIRFRSGHGADYIFLPKTAENLANAQQIAAEIENSIK